jgi:cytochrome P450
MMMNRLDLSSVDAKTLLSLLPVALGVLLFYNIKSSKKETIEGAVEYPPVAPVGTIQWMRARILQDYPLQSLAWCRQMASPVYRIKILFLDIFITNDIHLVRQVLKDEGSYKPALYNAFKAPHNGGDDILTSNGAFWKHSRKSIAPAFSSSHLKRMTETVKRVTEDFIKFRLDPMAEKGEPIDICKEIIDLTLTILSEAAFEYDMSDDEKEVLINGFVLTLNEGTKCFVFPLRSRFGKFLFPESKKAQLASS